MLIDRIVGQVHVQVAKVAAAVPADGSRGLVMTCCWCWYWCWRCWYCYCRQELMAREAGLSVDTAGFQAAMDAQKARSAAAAAAAKGDGAKLTLGPEQAPRGTTNCCWQ